MRPRSEIQSAIIYTQRTKDGDFIPRRVEVNSWVALYPGKRGGHCKDSKKYGISTIAGAYKAKILKFQLTENTISAVKVSHAYMHRQLQLDPTTPALHAACNYLYPTTHEDWIDLLSIMEPICVVHAEIGEATRGDRSHKELQDDSIFFYNASYHPIQGGYGRVEPIPLPDFNDPAWPLPDMATSESFRAHLREDFRMSMKPNTGSKATHLSWFMPIGVMVDLFACAPSIHKTHTFFFFKEMSQDLLNSLMDQGWNEKESLGADLIKCQVDQETLQFKYHIGRSTLYANFQYNRWRFIEGHWQQVDQSQAIEVVMVNCEMGEWKQQLEVGYSWNLDSIRSEILMILPEAVDFTMFIVRDGQPPKKVNRRHEKNKIAGDVLPPQRLQLIPHLM